LLVAFALLGLLRLNGFSLLEPDSPEYLFGARSLASFHGYRELDRAGEPLHTLRPPGLSVLLAPLTVVAPYPVVGAKIVVLAMALLAVALTMKLADRGGVPWAAPVVGLLVATSPYTLLHATEVATEIPYLACSLAAILLMSRSDDPPSRREVAGVALLLCALPFLRTIGLALVLATAISCVLRRNRRAFWPAPAAAIIAYGLWSVRNSFAGGPSYVGSILAELHRLGPWGFALESAEGAGFYASRFLDVVLPGVGPGRPLYERMIVGGAPDLGGLHGLGLVLALAIIALAARAAWSRRHREGSILLLYAAFYLIVLALYPPRHERLTWPMVPIVWALAAIGVTALGRPFRLAALAAASGLAVWQAGSSAAMARDNLAWLTQDDRFYEERVPPLYFADWRAAGVWLRENAPPSARVLTRHSDVAFTSGLVQESVRFEELHPGEWRSRIARLHARYLVVPASLFGKFFPFELLSSDPVYTYAVRWKKSDVAIIEVLPNRAGIVGSAARSQDASRCEHALAREPDRVDLQTRCAELLAAEGQRDVAITRLKERIGRGYADVRLTVALGNLLLEANRNDEAAAAFRQARLLPEAELLAQTIERGSKAAERTPAASDALARARARMDALLWDQARADIDAALASSPNDPAALRTAGELSVRLGHYEQAGRLYAAAAAKGDGLAGATGAALAEALAVEASLATAGPRAVVAAASFWAGSGSPGRALDILERAAATRPAETEITARLIDVRRFYGLD
jgi:tetratricopeptide (TPR) repeat protein